LGEVPLGSGKVITHTTLTATRPGYVRPLVLAMVDFGDGVRALGQLESDNPRVGMVVRPVKGKLGERNGIPIFGIKFVQW